MKLQLLAVFVLGCGGKNPPPTTASNTAPDPPPSAKPEQPATLEGQIDAFHKLLAAHWHEPAGPLRMKDTCAAIDKFQSAAGDIAGTLRSHPNAGIERAGAANQIQGATSNLGAKCGGTDLAAFDEAFKTLHDAFHKLHEMFGKKTDGDHPH